MSGLLTVRQAAEKLRILDDSLLLGCLTWAACQYANPNGVLTEEEKLELVGVTEAFVKAAGMTEHSFLNLQCALQDMVESGNLEPLLNIPVFPEAYLRQEISRVKKASWAVVIWGGRTSAVYDLKSHLHGIDGTPFLVVGLHSNGTVVNPRSSIKS